MERYHLRELATCLAAIVTSYVVAGVRLDTSIMNHDGINSLLAITSLLIETGDWKALAYRPEMFAGANLLGTYGVLPVTILLAKSPLSPVWTLNMTLVVVQTMFTFLATRAIKTIACVRYETALRDFLLTVVVCLVVAFSPMLAWRVEAGHLNLILGLLGIQAFMTLWIEAAHRTLSLATLSIVVIALVHAVCGQSFQILFYACIFALPLAIAYLFEQRRRYLSKNAIKPIAFSITTLLLGIVIALPILAAMIAYAYGPDTPRAPGSNPVVYTYLTSTAHDWFSALGWLDHGFSARAPQYLHELNYGLALAILLAIPLAHAKRLLLLGGLTVSVLLCLGFSTDATPISTAITTLFSPLQDFRVPARSIIPVIVVWQTLAIAHVLQLVIENRRSLARLSPAMVILPVALLIGVTVACLLLPDIGLEVLGWGASIALVVALVKRQGGLTEALCCSVAIISTAAYFRIVTLEVAANAPTNEARNLASVAFKQRPALSAPLQRVAINIDEVGVLTSAIGHLNSINGYGFPNRHFSELVQGLNNSPYAPARTYFNVLPRDPAFRYVQQLYNICCRVSVVNGALVMIDLDPTPGAVWSSRQRVPAMDLVESMNVTRELMHGQHWQAVQVAGDSKATFSDACESMAFGPIQAGSRSFDISITAPINADCPVTVSLTYASNIIAGAVNSGSLQPMAVTPAYGGLLGFIVPAGSDEIRIRSSVPLYPWSVFIACLASLAMLLAGHRWVRSQGKI